MKIITIVAARPNFMKVGPIIEAIKKYNPTNANSKVEHALVHTVSITT